MYRPLFTDNAGVAGGSDTVITERLIVRDPVGHILVHVEELQAGVVTQVVDGLAAEDGNGAPDAVVEIPPGNGFEEGGVPSTLVMRRASESSGSVPL